MCHCKHNVTVTGVTVSGEACTLKIESSFQSTAPLASKRERGQERKRDFAITPLEIIIGFTPRTRRRRRSAKTAAAVADGAAGKMMHDVFLSGVAARGEAERKNDAENKTFQLN